MAEITVQEVCWRDAEAMLSSIRQEVFVIEQHVPEALEWDGLDAHAIHLLASSGNIAIGCARVLADGHIGRMAVRASWRGQGAGRALLQAAIASCRVRGWYQVSLSAQTHAAGFYQRAGFVICSEEYLDAGIAHHDMKINLSD